MIEPLLVPFSEFLIGTSVSMTYWRGVFHNVLLTLLYLVIFAQAVETSFANYFCFLCVHNKPFTAKENTLQDWQS